MQFIELYDPATMGRLDEPGRVAPVGVKEALRDALDRGDLYGAVNMQTGTPSIRWLVVDDPEGSRGEIAEAMASWPAEGFHVEHMNEMMGLTYADLYDQRGEQAFRRWTGDGPQSFIRSSFGSSRPMSPCATCAWSLGHLYGRDGPGGGKAAPRGGYA